MFCARYLGAGGGGVRRACLSLVRKMVHYAPARLLHRISVRREPHTAALLTQLVAAVLDNQVSTLVLIQLLTSALDDRVRISRSLRPAPAVVHLCARRPSAYIPLPAPLARSLVSSALDDHVLSTRSLRPTLAWSSSSALDDRVRTSRSLRPIPAVVHFYSRPSE